MKKTIRYPTYPLTKHAFHICSDSIPLPQKTPDSLRSILHTNGFYLLPRSCQQPLHNRGQRVHRPHHHPPGAGAEASPSFGIPAPPLRHRLPTLALQHPNIRHQLGRAGVAQRSGLVQEAHDVWRKVRFGEFLEKDKRD